jgi:phospholipase/carboxylesterase
MTDLLERIELDPPGDAAADGSVIWLHGLGADGHDFEGIVPMLALGGLRLRFVFPHAPVRPVTINGGAEMRAWYDIDPREGLRSGGADIAVSARQVEALIAAERARGTPSRRIVLAGFSQGGVIALHTALRHEEPLAGVMALSTYLHDHEHVAEDLSFANLDLPLLMCHGRFDPMIPITRAITARETLLGLNFTVEWHEYDMGHQVCQAEIDDIGRWLRARLGA